MSGAGTLISTRFMVVIECLIDPPAVILELAREARGTKATTCGALTHLQQQHDGSSLPVTLGLAL